MFKFAHKVYNGEENEFKLNSFGKLYLPRSSIDLLFLFVVRIFDFNRQIEGTTNLGPLSISDGLYPA